jgi:hypothetical protein
MSCLTIVGFLKETDGAAAQKHLGREMHESTLKRARHSKISSEESRLLTLARSVNSLRQPQPARPRLSQLSDERGSGCGWPLVCRSPE